jgi:hypothetical protein
MGILSPVERNISNASIPRHCRNCVFGQDEVGKRFFYSLPELIGCLMSEIRGCHGCFGTNSHVWPAFRLGITLFISLTLFPA